jgi:CubicO group peptidase (beta-lactamase class C family)
LAKGNMSRVANIVSRHVAEGAYNGAAIIGSVGGEIVLEHYAGQAGRDLVSGPAVLWPIASISKMYAVSTILSLVEHGLVSLNMRVCDVIPAYVGCMREEVRLRHLLTHTAGLIAESPVMEARLKAHATLDALIDEMLACAPQFKPGTSVTYADNHTLLASHVVAKLVGVPFDDLVRAQTLLPMGLNDTFFPTPASEDHRTATVRGPMAEATSGAMYNSRHARGLAHPAFAVTSTARDLARFLSHFAPGGPRVHAEATVHAMRNNQTGLSTFCCASGPLAYEQVAPRPWGFGWALQTPSTPGMFSDLTSTSTFGHGGASGCQAFVDPEHDIAVVILTNTHLRTGVEPWFNRLMVLSNGVVSALGTKAQ